MEMIRFSKSIALDWENIFEEWSFGISLMPNTQFEFLDCSYHFYRGNEGHKFEELQIDYFGNSSSISERNIAERKLELSLKTLSYIFSLPLYNDDHYSWVEIDHIPTLNKKISKKKVDKIEDISHKINKLNKTRDLFNESILLFYAGLKYYFMLDYSEESFLNFYKVVEKIVKYDFEKSKDKIIKEFTENNKKKDIKQFVTLYTNTKYGIKYSEHKLDDLSNKFQSILIRHVCEDAFSKIALFCNKKGIRIKPDLLGSVISTRNRIVHGEVVNMDDYNKEYGYVFYLAQHIIAEKFLDISYDKIYIKNKSEL